MGKKKGTKTPHVPIVRQNGELMASGVRGKTVNSDDVFQRTGEKEWKDGQRTDSLACEGKGEEEETFGTGKLKNQYTDILVSRFLILHRQSSLN